MLVFPVARLARTPHETQRESNAGQIDHAGEVVTTANPPAPLPRTPHLAHAGNYMWGSKSGVKATSAPSLAPLGRVSEMICSTARNRSERVWMESFARMRFKISPDGLAKRGFYARIRGTSISDVLRSTEIETRRGELPRCMSRAESLVSKTGCGLIGSEKPA